MKHENYSFSDDESVPDLLSTVPENHLGIRFESASSFRENYAHTQIDFNRRNSDAAGGIISFTKNEDDDDIGLMFRSQGDSGREMVTEL